MRYLLSTILLVAACSHASKTPTKDTPAAPHAPAVAARSTASELKTMRPSQPVGSLVARLRYEAAHRPAIAPTADRALDALAHAGVALAGRRQYLGMAMHASYCAGGTARDGLVVAVCEYPTHAEAVAGKAYMDRAFAIADTTRVVHGAAVMTVVHPGALVTQAHQALAAFAAL